MLGILPWAFRGLFYYLAVRGSLVQEDSQQPIMQISLDFRDSWHLQS